MRQSVQRRSQYCAVVQLIGMVCVFLSAPMLLRAQDWSGGNYIAEAVSYYTNNTATLGFAAGPANGTMYGEAGFGQGEAYRWTKFKRTFTYNGMQNPPPALEVTPAGEIEGDIINYNGFITIPSASSYVLSTDTSEYIAGYATPGSTSYSLKTDLSSYQPSTTTARIEASVYVTADSADDYGYAAAIVTITPL